MEKVNRHLAKPTPQSLAALHKKLTGKDLPPDGVVKLEAALGGAKPKE